jgi:hypothetical protein
LKTLNYIEFSEDYIIIVKGNVFSLWQDETEKRLRLVAEVYKRKDGSWENIRSFEEIIAPPLFKKSSWKAKAIKGEENVIKRAKLYIAEQLKDHEMTENLYDSLDNYR